MYRCHPQIPKLLEIIKNKTIGEIESIETSFGYDTGKTIPESRIFNKELTGGAILDVGLYPISFSRLISGVATGEKFLEPNFINAEGRIGDTGVDEVAHANLEFKNGIKAKVSTAIRESMKNNAIILGSEGTIELPDPWMPGRNGGPYHAKIIINKNGRKK